ncbi:adenylate/guanylate cyclase domain-containing protein [Nitrososphaera sp.]|uniref:adenylate/guanylate cyclase domain-containing protein n=1 Tax=Nitrososphaera sp. TaxID=1971748 RepID=UPI00307FB491
MTLNPESVERRQVPRYVQKTVSGKKGFYDSMTNQFIPAELFALAEKKAVDAGSMIVEKQSRVFRSLRYGMTFEAATGPADSFLRAHLYHKVPMVMLYADIVGSTNMSLTVPVDTLSAIIQVFFQETSIAITEHGGYVLKYAGDSVLAFFPLIGSEASRAEDRAVAAEAVACGKEIVTAIQQVINPILNEYYYPELAVRVGVDAGQCAVVLYGSDKKASYVDILGPCISLAAKMKSLARPDSVIAGQAVHDLLAPEQESLLLSPLKVDIERWNYVDDSTGSVYRLYQVL